MGTAATLPYVKFLPNIPVDLAFKFADGKPIAGRYGPSVMFTTTKDELAFFHPTQAAEIEALRLAPGEPIRVTKTRDEQNRPCFKFEKLGAQQDGTFVVPKVGGASPSQVTAPLASISQVHPNTGPQHSTDGAGGGAGNGAGGRPMSDSPYEHSGVSLFLREQTNMLIDVFASCVAYAQRYNGACKPDDVRNLLITTYIQHSKGPRG